MNRNYAEEMAYCDGDVDNMFKNLKNNNFTNEIKRMQSKTTQTIIKKEKEVVFWELKDGKKIDIDTMTEQHLKNILKLIVTRGLLKDKL